MKKFSPIIFVFTVIIPFMFTSNIALAKDIKGNGNLITQSIPISSFSKIEIETTVTVDYSQAKNPGKLEFTVDKNLWDYYDISTKGNVLRIQLKREFRNISLSPTKSLLTVSSENLEKIEIAGSSRINFCTDYTSKKLEIEVAGSGKVVSDEHSVQIGDCIVEIAGSGKVFFIGTIQNAKIDIAGSGRVEAAKCKISQLNVDIAGSGSVEAHVIDKLDVDIAGSGKVIFSGDPHPIRTDIAGSGKVKKVNSF